MKTKQGLSAAARAFRDAMRDIAAEEGRFEVELAPEWRKLRRSWMTPHAPNATA